MQVVFLSNYFTHHQEAFSDEMNKLLKGNYYFISCKEMDTERISMGWSLNNEPNYVHKYYAEKAFCDNLINNCDILITGSAPIDLFKRRLAMKKTIFLYSERLDKKPISRFKLLKNKIKTNYYFFGKKQVYYLCSSAFTSYDVSRRIPIKCFKWGYFPKTIIYPNVIDIINAREDECIQILFTSRLIGWKHPELPIMVASKLKLDGIKFHLTIIGTGELEDLVKQLIRKHNLENEITHIQSMSPDSVRFYMEKSSIFLFTSDRNEGWGAVLNESMNSGCAVVASSEIGSVPYLLEDGKNGYIYEDGNFDDLYNKVRTLCEDKRKRINFGEQAYLTITNYWNAECAAKRFLQLVNSLNDKNTSPFKDGPCSIAEIIKDGWYERNF